MDISLEEFISHSNGCNTVAELTNVFLQYVSSFGLSRFVMSDCSPTSGNIKKDKHGILVNYPPDWMNHYQDNQYIDNDAIYNKALVSPSPFTWQSVREDPHTSTEGIKILDEAQEYHLYDGIGMGIHRPHGQVIGIGLAAANKGVGYNSDIISKVNLSAHQFLISYDRIQSLECDQQSISLSPKEVDTLFWLTRGKNISDISELMSISENTVKFHLKNVYAKLSVNCQVEAVVKAMRLGIIYPH